MICGNEIGKLTLSDEWMFEKLVRCLVFCTWRNLILIIKKFLNEASVMPELTPRNLQCKGWLLNGWRWYGPDLA